MKNKTSKFLKTYKKLLIAGILLLAGLFGANTLNKDNTTLIIDSVIHVVETVEDATMIDEILSEETPVVE